MKITAIKTDRISASTITLEELVDKALPTLAEKSIIAITSKVVSLCEGRVVPEDTADKLALVQKEASRYLSPEGNSYGIIMTITLDTLIASAGIDSSNGDGNYILWPADPQTSANAIRKHLRTKHGLQDLGIVITDSKTTPLRWGTTGVAIGYSGFKALTTYIGEPDLFGRPMEVTKANIVEGLAAAAVLAMGEGTEQTPLALIGEATMVTFQDEDPSLEELAAMRIDINDDLYAPLLTSAPWIDGEGK